MSMEHEEGNLPRNLDLWRPGRNVLSVSEIRALRSLNDGRKLNVNRTLYLMNEFLVVLTRDYLQRVESEKQVWRCNEVVINMEGIDFFGEPHADKGLVAIRDFNVEFENLWGFSQI